VKILCPKCKKPVDVAKGKKVAPHKDGNVRCGGSGRRVEGEKK
jgi:hypothetical protein